MARRNDAIRSRPDEPMRSNAAPSPVFSCIAVAAALLSLSAPARAASRPAGSTQSEYHAIVLDKQGGADASALDELTAALDRDVQAGAGEIVVMVHGFAVTRERGTEEFSEI